MPSLVLPKNAAIASEASPEKWEMFFSAGLKKTKVFFDFFSKSTRVKMCVQRSKQEGVNDDASVILTHLSSHR